MESEKTLFVGDLHCKQEDVLPRVDGLVEELGIGRVVLLGDYTDEWNSTAADVLAALEVQKAWLADRAKAGLDVTYLLGNHDFEYLRTMGCGGTHREAIFEIRESLSEIEMAAAACIGCYLVTHAGLTQRWRDENIRGCDDAETCASRINEMFLGEDPRDWKRLASAGRSRGGDGTAGPLWADAADLYMDEAAGINQIVGHTPVASCERLDFIDEEIWLCDTFSLTSHMRRIGNGTMLLLDDGRASVVFPSEPE